MKENIVQDKILEAKRIINNFIENNPKLFVEKFDENLLSKTYVIFQDTFDILRMEVTIHNEESIIIEYLVRVSYNDFFNFRSLYRENIPFSRLNNKLQDFMNISELRNYLEKLSNIFGINTDYRFIDKFGIMPTIEVNEHIEFQIIKDTIKHETVVYLIKNHSIIDKFNCNDSLEDFEKLIEPLIINNLCEN